ncbi:MAG: PAS domain S-box protein [Armatimonadetes bacterium]|nr:PAS domain S-box protein [Armatimonadota bacterium]
MGRSGLSRRERQILELAASGHIDQAIANDLGISVPTVSTYWCRIREKYGRLNRAELVAKFVQEREEAVASELRSNNERLAGQLDEAAVRSAALAREVATFEAMLDSAPGPVMIVTSEGVVHRANRLAAELFGWSQEELVGLHVGELMPETVRAGHRRHREAYLAAMPGPIEISSDEGVDILHRNGKLVRVQIHLNAMDTPNGRMVVCFFRPLDDPPHRH